MMLTVYNNGFLHFDQKTYKCAIGKNGITQHKVEGDLKTPEGTFFLRKLYYREDKLSKPETLLPSIAISKDDGWCDDITSKDYNQHITLPSSKSHEELWRDDDKYDLIIPISYNDDPILRNKGSAIFIHLIDKEYSGTEGCIALAKDDLIYILKKLSLSSKITISNKSF